MVITRRLFVAAIPTMLAGCASTRQRDLAQEPAISPHYLSMYAAIDDEPFPIPAPDLSKIDPQYYRQEVAYDSGHAVGAIIVDTEARFLYLQQENGRALRYGIGVGKAGLEFEGAAVVQYKRNWPRWTPTADMIAREPERNLQWKNGMEPGLNNPLGARALYLFRNGRDTLYRIHGTHEDWSIGRAISSGCIRLLNQDIIDLHRRVPNGAEVIVLQQGSEVVAGLEPLSGSISG